MGRKDTNLSSLGKGPVMGSCERRNGPSINSLNIKATDSS